MEKPLTICDVVQVVAINSLELFKNLYMKLQKCRFGYL